MRITCTDCHADRSDVGLFDPCPGCGFQGAYAAPPPPGPDDAARAAAHARRGTLITITIPAGSPYAAVEEVLRHLGDFLQSLPFDDCDPQVSSRLDGYDPQEQA